MANLIPLIGLFGGTFDPIHKGHWSIATQLLKEFPFEKIQLIPCGDHPPHREAPFATIKDRLAMIRLAIQGQAHLEINPIETEHQAISYSIQTLKILHQQDSKTALGFILSTENLAHLNQWHQWENLLDYCHLIVVPRARFSVPREPWLHELLNKHLTQNPTDLITTRNGKIIFTDWNPPPYSATQIRRAIQEKKMEEILDALPTTVADYIKDKGLYGGN